MPTDSSSRRRTLFVAIPIAIVLLVLGGWFVIDQIQGDPPVELTFDDVTTTTSADGTTTTGDATVPEGIEGAWTIAEASSTAGYRVKEVLFGSDGEAVGRTDQVTGSLQISGTTVTATEVEVDMTSVSSDRSQRDGQFQNRIMSTDQFPTATFTLTEPIDLGSVPADGEEISFTLTGDLTLRGVTKSVTAELKAKLDGGTIVINGKLPIDFDDFEIPDASGGPASVGRDGDLELLLVFSR